MSYDKSKGVGEREKRKRERLSNLRAWIKKYIDVGGIDETGWG